MGKLWVEVTLNSARGLRRLFPSILKCQWYAVGWIDSKNKYCTTIDAAGTAHPVWKTKFATLLDDELGSDSLSLYVEVYRRDPIFLREKLYGEATIVLKEFLNRHSRYSENNDSGVEDSGTYQLRNRNSKGARGLIDISVRISKDSNPKLGLSDDAGRTLAMSDSSVITLSSESSYQPVQPQFPIRRQIAEPNHISQDSNPQELAPVTASFVSNVQPSHVGAGALAAGALIFGDELLPKSGNIAAPTIPF